MGRGGTGRGEPPKPKPEPPPRVPFSPGGGPARRPTRPFRGAGEKKEEEEGRGSWPPKTTTTPPDDAPHGPRDNPTAPEGAAAERRRAPPPASPSQPGHARGEADREQRPGEEGAHPTHVLLLLGILAGLPSFLPSLALAPAGSRQKVPAGPRLQPRRKGVPREPRPLRFPSPATAMDATHPPTATGTHTQGGRGRAPPALLLLLGRQHLFPSPARARQLPRRCALPPPGSGSGSPGEGREEGRAEPHHRSAGRCRRREAGKEGGRDRGTHPLAHRGARGLPLLPPLLPLLLLLAVVVVLRHRRLCGAHPGQAEAPAGLQSGGSNAAGRPNPGLHAAASAPRPPPPPPGPPPPPSRRVATRLLEDDDEDGRRAPFWGPRGRGRRGRSRRWRLRLLPRREEGPCSGLVSRRRRRRLLLLPLRLLLPPLLLLLLLLSSATSSSAAAAALQLPESRPEPPLGSSARPPFLLPRRQPISALPSALRSPAPANRRPPGPPPPLRARLSPPRQVPAQARKAGKAGGSQRTRHGHRRPTSQPASQPAGRTQRARRGGEGRPHAKSGGGSSSILLFHRAPRLVRGDPGAPGAASPVPDEGMPPAPPGSLRQPRRPSCSPATLPGPAATACAMGPSPGGKKETTRRSPGEVSWAPLGCSRLLLLLLSEAPSGCQPRLSLPATVASSLRALLLPLFLCCPHSHSRGRPYSGHPLPLPGARIPQSPPGPSLRPSQPELPLGWRLGRAGGVVALLRQKHF